MLEPGDILLGKYRIERVLGKGGMGVVVRAHHLQLDAPMAIKFLQPEALEKPTVVQRFLREAQAAVKLDNPHVCKVFDVGTLNTGAPYMVMEYLDGMDLRELIRSQGALPVAVAIDYMSQACAALGQAHALGIVHRDIKPSNFFLTRRADGSNVIKLLDFGISKAPTTVSEELTTTQTTLGTPAYMSPEQLRASKEVDARSDIWSLGVVLYELLAGHRPFTGNTFSALCLKIAMNPLPELDMDLPSGLEQVVNHCLEKEPEDRFQTVAELAVALEPYAATQDASRSQRTATARPVTGGRSLHSRITVIGEQTPSTVSQGAGEFAVNAPRQRRSRLLAGVLALALAGGAVALMVLKNGDERQPASVSASVSDEPGMAAEPGATRAADEPPDYLPPVTEIVVPHTEVDTEAAAAEPAKLEFVIESNPAGARIHHEGQNIGTTPGQVAIPRGKRWALVLSLPGYQSADIELPGAADDQGKAVIALQRVKRRSSTSRARKRKRKKPTEKRTGKKTDKKRPAKQLLDGNESLGWED